MKKVEIGDHINVDIHEPRSGKFPIGRYNGIICKLEIPREVGHLEYGCTVLATVAIIEPKYIKVLVEEVVRSAAYNKSEFEAKLSQLKEIGTKQKGHNKKVKNYPYLSKQEL